MRTARAPAGGFTYIGLLVAVVILGLMLTMASRVWRTTEQREREAQLLWVGHAYRMAISSYVAFGHQYPPTLEVLLTDDRFPVPKRHLRQLYADPMTGKADWTLVTNPNGPGIMGVASSSQAAPIKRDGFAPVDSTFKDADCYCQWKFVYYLRGYGGAPTNTSLPPLPDTPPAPPPPPGMPGSGAPGTVNPYPNPSGPGGPSGHH